MSFSVEGDYFEVCSCDVSCNCVWLGAATNDNCDVLLAWHVTQGSKDGVDLSGLNAVMAVHSPKRMTDGGWKVALYLDDRASAEQSEALGAVFSGGAGGYLAGLGPSARVHSLADVIAFNQANRTREMPFFGQELMLRAQKKGPLTDKAYRDALAKNLRLSRQEGIDKVMDRLRLDALVAPTGSPAWVTDLVNGDHFLGASSTPAAVAGYPSITVPAGSAFGLPVGISFIGRPWTEARLLGLAYAYEQATRHRRPPAFPATVDLEVR